MKTITITQELHGYTVRERGSDFGMNEPTRAYSTLEEAIKELPNLFVPMKEEPREFAKP